MARLQEADYKPATEWPLILEPATRKRPTGDAPGSVPAGLELVPIKQKPELIGSQLATYIARARAGAVA